MAFRTASNLLKHGFQSSRSIATRRNIFSLQGVYSTVATPFNEKDESVDFSRLEIMLRHLNRFPLAGFAMLGVFGEFTSLSFEAKIEVIKHARKYLGDDRIILAGAGMEG